MEINKKEAKRLYDIEYRKKNKKRLNKQKQNWAKANSDKVKIYKEQNKDKKKISDKKYAQKTKVIQNARKKAWAKANPDKVKKAKYDYVKRKLNFDPLYKLKHYITCAIRQSFKRNGYSKKSKTAVILNCSFEELKKYIESKFEDWMSWDNYGLYNGELKYGWDIDHIIPISSAKNEEDVIKLNHFTNLQPLCSYTNRHIKKNLI